MEPKLSKLLIRLLTKQLKSKRKTKIRSGSIRISKLVRKSLLKNSMEITTANSLKKI